MLELASPLLTNFLGGFALNQNTSNRANRKQEEVCIAHDQGTRLLTGVGGIGTKELLD